MTAADDHAAEQEWIDEHAGPVVRPYAMTRGRTRPSKGRFDLISLVVATRAEMSPQIALGPEHVAIIAFCRYPQSVAEVAAHLNVPLGTTRVLLGDLLVRNLVEVREPRPADSLTDDSVFEAAINGLRAL